MKNISKQNGLFVTGTDTNVGKTYIGSQIVALLHEMNSSIMPRKPIESGCDLIDGELQPADANQYFDAVKKSIPLFDICPFRFQPAISPQRAARLISQTVTIKEVHQACIKNVNESDFLFIEGAGGFYSPLCEDGLNADLAKSLQLPVLLIANDQLGCINHILLTAEAIRRNNLVLCAVILNSKETKHDNSMDNFEDLKTHLNVPFFSISNNEIFRIDASETKAILDTITNCK